MMASMQSFARLARAAVVVLDGSADPTVPAPEQTTRPSSGPVPYDVDDNEDTEELSTTIRRVNHDLIADTLFEVSTPLEEDADGTPQVYLSMSTSGGGCAGSWEPEQSVRQDNKHRKGKSCLRFARDQNVVEAAAGPSSFCCDDGSLRERLTADFDGSSVCSTPSRRYHSVNFTAPLERRADSLVLLPYRDMMQEHISLSASTASSALGATYALSPSVEIPRNVVPQLLLQATGDPALRSVIMRVFYTALGDTILASDPSSPSGAGPTGLSLLQFRELGKGCNSAAATVLNAKCGGPLRQPMMTAIFECAAKPFQFLSVTSFCVALSLLALSASSTPASDDLPSTPSKAGGSKKIVETIVENLHWLCREVLMPYIAAELPVWADPDVDVYWADRNAQRTTLEYAKITKELFEIFSVSPADEIASMLRRGSNFAHRASSLQEGPPPPATNVGSGNVPTPPNRRLSRPVQSAPRKLSTRHVVSFLDAASRKSSVVPNEQVRTSPPVANEEPSDESPAERLKRYGFDVCVSPHEPMYFVNGCDQLRILTLATLQRMVRTMNIPNVSPMDVAMAAKAASHLYRGHPFRRLADQCSSTSQGVATQSSKHGGGASSKQQQHTPSTTTTALSNLFGAGVNPLTRFVPSGDIFLLESEFVDALMRLSIVAYPELVQQGAVPGGVRRTVRRRSFAASSEERRGSISQGHRRGSLVGGALHEPQMDAPSSTLPQFQLSEYAPEAAQVREANGHDSNGPLLAFADAYQRVMRTYIEGFYLSATGAGTVDSGKISIVSAEEATKVAAQKDTRTAGRRASTAVSQTDVADLTAPTAPAPFVLAQPVVRELAVTESDSGATAFFFQSDRAREAVPGWEASKHTNIVSDHGGDAVIQGHLMLDITGFYVLLEGRVAIRAHRVLAATLSQGKKLSTIEEAANLATLAEIRIPPLTSLFSNRFIERYLEPHRAVRCDRDGANGLRVYPYTFVSLSLQYSNDGVHWTPVTSDRLETKWSRLAHNSEAALNANCLLVKQCRPTHVVPQSLTEALRIIFNVYASYQEVVKEAVITTGKWAHLCACLMYVVRDATGTPPKCVAQPPDGGSGDGNRRSSRALTVGWSDAGDGAVPSGGPEAAAAAGGGTSSSRNDCQRCTNCLIANMQAVKMQHPIIELVGFSNNGQKMGDAAGVVGDASSLPREGGAKNIYAFDPQTHVPRITHQHVLEAFEKHSQTRSIHQSDATHGGAHPDAVSYRVLSFEGMVAAITDLVINHNTTCDKQPLSMRATELLMVPSNWWTTIYGLLVLEGERRKACHADCAQVDAKDIHILPRNTHAQWAFRKLWSVNASGIAVSVDPSESAAQRSLATLCSTFLNVARRVRSLSIFRHGACVAKVHDDPKHLAWDGGSGSVLRNNFLTIEVFSPPHTASIQRLIGIELPFNATIERLFKGGFLPLAVDDASYTGQAPSTSSARRGNGDPISPSKPSAGLTVDRRRDAALVTTSARRFWILRDATTTAAVGCMSNLPGHCATLSWVPSLGSYHSMCGSLLLMEHSDVLTTESLLIFKHFLECSAAVDPSLSYAERTLVWVRAERSLRQELESECGLVMDPVFP